MMTPDIRGRFKGALIDMDGVLFDSMKGHTRAWQEMMRTAGVECDRDEFYLYEGMTGKATIDLLFRRTFGHGVSDEEAKRLYAIKTERFRSYGPAPLIEGADRMLRALGELGLIRVLVTGSAQSSLLDNIDRAYPGVFPPGRRITANDVTHGKPNPEPYLKGAAIAGAAPEECIVVENAPLGVRAGKAAGCFTVAVTTGLIPREAFGKEGADIIFGSMPEFAGWLEKMAGTSADTVSEPLIFDNDISAILSDCIRESGPDKTFLITDTNVERAVVPELREFIERNDVNVITVAAGEESKSIETLSAVWRKLAEGEATRRSLLLCVGGGMVSDLGGFAAATFKRGIRCVNVPTTLLAQADASIGGKTGIDFLGLKNEIGAFAQPEKVIISATPLATLPHKEFLNGLAEVVKTALISNVEIYNSLRSEYATAGSDRVARAARRAAMEKQRIVDLDPKEQGLRRILNFGHTAGHAFESLAARRHAEDSGFPVLAHGEAVAHGMLTALMLSAIHTGLDPRHIEEYRNDILEHHYNPLPFDADDIPQLVELMGHDNKNSAYGLPSFVLLSAPGEPVAGIAVEPEDIASILSKQLQPRASR